MCTPQLVLINAVKHFTPKETTVRDNTKILFWFAVIVFLVIAGPLCTIWALNTLFPALAIPYTLETWVAAVVLFGIAHSGFSVRK